ncbi:MAG: alpha/beta hydrolase [Pyrinomonadaceae bacterium]
MPLALLCIIAVGGLTAWVTYTATPPPRRGYRIPPLQGGRLSSNAFKITDEIWTNRDTTTARGWLLRGTERAPAVILLHGYGADRSWLLNLGVKLNEATSDTILWVDMRGHGESDAGQTVSFGVHEGDDLAAAIAFLSTLKTPQGQKLIGDSIGVYGVEAGAFAALTAAGQMLNTSSTGATNPTLRIRALVLDSIPATPDEMLKRAVLQRTEIDSTLLFEFARLGIRIAHLGAYKNSSACEIAANLRDVRVLLLSGAEAGALRDSTQALSPCFPNQVNVETQPTLPITGLNSTNATGEQGDRYDRRVIEFFDRTFNTQAGITPVSTQ